MDDCSHAATRRSSTRVTSNVVRIISMNGGVVRGGEGVIVRGHLLLGHAPQLLDAKEKGRGACMRVGVGVDSA